MMNCAAMDGESRDGNMDMPHGPFDLGFNGGLPGGTFTVFFRLVSCDVSPGHNVGDLHSVQPITPLNTPFTQSPIHSPIQQSSPSLAPNVCIPSGDHMLYPLPPPTATIASPVLPGQSTGVYYTQAAPAPPQSYFPVAHMDQFIKQRAASVELEHSPPFQYSQPHRGSFCVPMNEKDLTLVSEEMLLSAMPDRYDD